MDHGVKGKRGKQKVLERSRHMVNGRDSPEKYVAVDKLLTNFETVWRRVRGMEIGVRYKGGYYYIGPLKWTRSMLERELIQLLKEEQKLNQLEVPNGNVFTPCE